MHAQLYPYIVSEDARIQAAFYQEALGGEIQSILTFGEVPDVPESHKDRVMHMVLTIAGHNSIFLSDSFEPVSFNHHTISLALRYDNEPEARKALENLSKDGKVVFPLEIQSWGNHYGEVLDKFGVTWRIVAQ